MKTRHISMFSGGIASWGASKIVFDERIQPVADNRLQLVFTDTCMEDEDLYRFLPQAAANVFRLPDPLPGLRPLLDAIPPLERLEERPPFLRALASKVMELIPGLVWLIDGRSPWDIFYERRVMGSSRMDPCSHFLKRLPAKMWLEENCRQNDTVVYVGIAWNERHRFEGVGMNEGIRHRQAEAGWEYDAPLLWPPRLDRQELFDWLKEQGIAPPRLYTMGFSHNNCGGWCVRAGQSHFRKLLAMMPERYRYHEERERHFSKLIDKPVAVLRDRRGGITRPLPMSLFRERIEGGEQMNLFDSHGCGCFINDLEQENDGTPAADRALFQPGTTEPAPGGVQLDGRYEL